MRRTSTIDATWPGGRGAGTVLTGRARDLRTPAEGEPRVVAEASMRVNVGTDRRITEVVTDPGAPGTAALVGGPSQSGYRALLAGAVPGEITAATPLHLLLDDVPGAALVSGVAFRCWHGGPVPAVPVDRSRLPREGACIGYQPGSSALEPEEHLRWTRRTARADEVDSGEDAMAWHPLRILREPSLRRSRRIDVWTAGDTVHVDAFFQDAAALPGGGRQVVHEYTLTAEADRATGILRALTPVPRVLPHHECPLAVVTAARVVGLPLAGLRPAVLRELRGTAGCTHLNDTLRALADVPALAETLTGTAGGRRPGSEGEA
ncbi:DUF2889 family protein [Actinocorallia herbida]|uniref:DUF2889 family protein n=1 Tax=Actinocorallia herbida TaxID=58109 RepID=A0A3N1D1Y8_9ACTN|nr:DUF2889 domain-containing protein [Actinocorallia herbida]ROO87496.1 DUF2889 family protein [Actinocorallia herbida]